MRYFFKPLITLSVFVLLTVVFGQAQENLKEIQAEIEKINKEMEKAVLEGNFDAQLKLFADDIMIDHPLEPPVRGREALRDQFNRNRKEGLKYHSFSGTIEDFWVSGKRVYERGTWGMLYTTKRLKQPVAAYGSYFQIWTKHGSDSWQIQYLIFTLDFNPYDFGR